MKIKYLEEGRSFKFRLSVLYVSGILIGGPSLALAAGGAPAKSSAPAVASVEAEPVVLRFTINGYMLEGATLLNKEEAGAALAPFIGKDKDFSDVQRALEAVEELYANKGYSAVHVLLPEQELEKGNVRFRIVESRFGKVEVKDNRYFSNANVLNAIPSVRVGGVPRSREIAKELKLANENPARQLNVVLKAGEKEEDVDASVMVTDSEPAAWGASFDNSGSPETGSTRLGLSYRHANVFDADHVASIQYLMSPQHPDSTRVIGGSYKIPLYEAGSSLEFFGGYSNVNALMGGFDKFQGGGVLFSARYNYGLERLGIFDPRLSFGFDWRKFRRLEMTGSSSTTVVYNDIVVTPLSLTYLAQGKFDKSDLNFNVSVSANLPKAGGGKADDFANYDTSHITHPESAYKVLRYGLSYTQVVADEWQFRAALNGQWSKDELIQGEQIRLGGADAVRGFSEGSEGGEIGTRLNLEMYSPDFGKNEFKARALVFYDVGQTRPVIETNSNKKVTVAGTGAGLRMNYTERLSMRVDRARITNAGSDIMQNVGDWRWHASLNATF